jgi:hypothetical protein
MNKIRAVVKQNSLKIKMKKILLKYIKFSWCVRNFRVSHVMLILVLLDKSSLYWHDFFKFSVSVSLTGNLNRNKILKRFVLCFQT